MSFHTNNIILDIIQYVPDDESGSIQKEIWVVNIVLMLPFYDVLNYM